MGVVAKTRLVIGISVDDIVEFTDNQVIFNDVRVDYLEDIQLPNEIELFYIDGNRQIIGKELKHFSHHDDRDLCEYSLDDIINQMRGVYTLLKEPMRKMDLWDNDIKIYFTHEIH